MRIKSPLLIKAAGRLGFSILRAVFSTLKQDLHTAVVNPYNSLGPQRYLFSVWHDSSIIAAFAGKHHRTVALTSRHRDGSFVESIVAPLGVKSVRGSTGRSGQRAARALLEMAKDYDVVMTPDGPRGPRRTMSRGIVYLSSRTGSPIVPTAFACKRSWEIKSSWTTHQVPRPFTKVVLLAGQPIVVPADIGTEGLETYQALAQQAMDDLQDVAARQLIRPQDDPLKLGTKSTITAEAA